MASFDERKDVLRSFEPLRLSASGANKQKFLRRFFQKAASFLLPGKHPARQ
jgi:hypothetical protein